MDEKKIYFKYASKEERLIAWKEQRASYDEWRHTPEGEKWVTRKTKDQLGLCFICLTPLYAPIHVDHIFPLYLGGTSSSANMCVTHADCNMRKGVKVYMTYKEVGKRRRIFNNLEKGVKAYRILKLKPKYKPTKKQTRGLKLLLKYFTQEYLDGLTLITDEDRARVARKAKQREERKNIKGFCKN